MKSVRTPPHAAHPHLSLHRVAMARALPGHAYDRSQLRVRTNYYYTSASQTIGQIVNTKNTEGF